MMTAATVTDVNTSDCLDVLRDVWGYEEFRPLQTESIAAVLEGRDSLTVLPTGGGKSLCYQVPAVAGGGLAVVVSPLISLMQDQVDALRDRGVPAAAINSTMTADDKRQVNADLAAGKLRLLYVAPERLLAQGFIPYLKRHDVRFFAIDEAHCISAWGHDFRPEYRGLASLKGQFPGASVHAYTATASPKVREDIVSQLGLDQPAVLVGSFDRPNLSYRIVDGGDRLQAICDVVARHPSESGIIYCISRKETERTAASLNAANIRALPYHAGMADTERVANQNAFMKEDCDVIVATVAFGMGIDKSNVRYVVHAGIPKSIEHYQQESGRAGRDGLPSECVIVYRPSDRMAWERILSQGSPQQFEQAKSLLDEIAGFCTRPVCRHRQLVEYFGQAYETDNCDACDVCLGELDLVDDSMILAQKILSCVVRLGERYGVGHTAEVLSGGRGERIAELGHDKLSTYGLLKDQSLKAIKGWVEQLVQQEFLLREGDYAVLKVTPAGRRLLKGNGDVRLTKPTEDKPRRRSADASWDGVDRGLFESLRQWRKAEAGHRGVPPYVILGDETLRQIARRKTLSRNDLSAISGLGGEKIRQYGQSLVELHAEYVDREGHQPLKQRTTTAVNASSATAFPLFEQGLTVAEAAAQLSRAESTTANYLIDYLQTRKVTDASPWVSEEVFKKIAAVQDAAADGKLRPVFEALGGEIGYNEIKIALTVLRNRQTD